MSQRGDGIYLRGKSWYLDCRIDGRRHVVRLGKSISRTVAIDLARVNRAAILKGEAGIGRKRKDLAFDKAAEAFLEWATINKRPNTARGYRTFLAPLRAFFGGKSLGQISTFEIERYKRARIEAKAPVAANRELAILKCLFNRCRDWGPPWAWGGPPWAWGGSENGDNVD